MAVEAIGIVPPKSVGLQEASVGLEDFLQIFLTQLNFQDPLEPVDNREFIAQLAQFSSLEVNNRSNQNLETLLDLSAVSQTIGLLGKSVQVNAGASQVVGEVTSVRFAGGSPLLTLKTEEGNVLPDLRPSQITLVR